MIYWREEIKKKPDKEKKNKIRKKESQAVKKISDIHSDYNVKSSEPLLLFFFSFFLSSKNTNFASLHSHMHSVEIDAQS